MGITALGVASARAVESRRPDRLLDDPPSAKVVQWAQRELAEAFGSGAHGAAQAGPVDEEAVRAFPEYAAVRTRYFDDCLLQACAAGCRQVGRSLGWSPQLGHDLCGDQLDLVEVRQVKQLQVDSLDPGVRAPGPKAIDGLGR